MIGRRFTLDRMWLIGTAVALVAGLALAAADRDGAADLCWIVATCLGGIRSRSG